MKIKKRLLVVPAAGKGSRLAAEVPKPLVKVNGRTLIERVVSAFPDFDYAIVIHPEMQKAFEESLMTRLSSIHWFFQNEARGMADAIAKTLELLPQYQTIAIAWADLVWMRAEDIRALVEAFELSSDTMQIPGFFTQDPYTGILTDHDLRIERIIESREENLPSQLAADLGLFFLKPAIQNLFNVYMSDRQRGYGKKTGEKNFLPFAHFLYQQNQAARLKILARDIPLVGVNTPHELDLLRQGEMKS